MERISRDMPMGLIEVYFRGTCRWCFWKLVSRDELVVVDDTMHARQMANMARRAGGGATQCTAAAVKIKRAKSARL